MPKVWNLKTQITSALRQVWRFSPIKKEAMKLSRVSWGRYRCAQCQILFPPKEIRVDHIEPVVAVDKETDWNAYITRLFCTTDKLQVLCKACHDVKTKEENHARRLAQKERKLSESEVEEVD